MRLGAASEACRHRGTRIDSRAAYRAARLLPAFVRLGGAESSVQRVAAGASLPGLAEVRSSHVARAPGHRTLPDRGLAPPELRRQRVGELAREVGARLACPRQARRARHSLAENHGASIARLAVEVGPAILRAPRGHRRRPQRHRVQRAARAGRCEPRFESSPLSLSWWPAFSFAGRALAKRSPAPLRLDPFVCVAGQALLRRSSHGRNLARAHASGEPRFSRQRRRRALSCVPNLSGSNPAVPSCPFPRGQPNRTRTTAQVLLRGSSRQGASDGVTLPRAAWRPLNSLLDGRTT